MNNYQHLLHSLITPLVPSTTGHTSHIMIAPEKTYPLQWRNTICCSQPFIHTSIICLFVYTYLTIYLYYLFILSN